MNASNRCSQEMKRVFFFSLVFTCFVGSIIILLLYIIIRACDIFHDFFFNGKMANGKYSNPMCSSDMKKCWFLTHVIIRDV